MTQVTLEEAQQDLARLIQEARDGEEIVLLENGCPVARLVSIAPSDSASSAHMPHASRGSGKGQILYMAPDFDAPIEDFAEYMP